LGIISQAEQELRSVNFGDADSKVMLAIMEMFFDQWDSGGSVHVAADVLVRLLNGQPLSPLTGGAEEWEDVSEATGSPMWQNRRDFSVFKDGSGKCYDIDTPGRPAITFPYVPKTSLPADPVIEVNI
jgi:hypothetical protein